MDAWILQQDFPIVDVNSSEATSTTRVTQQLYNIRSYYSINNDSWSIPVFYRIRSQPNQLQMKWIHPG